MRKELKKLRVDHDFTQEDVAKKLGIATPSYSLIERGIRHGSPKTWEKIQKLYGIPDAKMWGVQKNG